MKCGVVTVRSIERYPFSILSSGDPTDYRYFTVVEVAGEFIYTGEMWDWAKTVALNKKTPNKDVGDITPTYDGTILYWDGIKVVRDDKHDEDLEKAVMILLLKKEGYCFGDTKNVIKKTKIKWVPRERERFYYINDAGKVSSYAYVKGFAIHELFIKFGNCFKMKEEAMVKLEQVKKLLSE